MNESIRNRPPVRWDYGDKMIVPVALTVSFGCDVVSSMVWISIESLN